MSLTFSNNSFVNITSQVLREILLSSTPDVQNVFVRYMSFEILLSLIVLLSVTIVSSETSLNVRFVALVLIVISGVMYT